MERPSGVPSYRRHSAGVTSLSFGEYWRARMAAILVCGQAKVAGSNSQPFDDGLEATEASTEHHSDRGA